MSIIIVEGSDLAGKTYFIERFAKHMNSGITIKNNFKPNNKDSTSSIYKQYDTIMNLARAFSKCLDKLVILDRFFPSQAVYSFYRGVCELEDTRGKILENVALGLGVKIIYLNTPLPVLLERYDKRGDEHIQKEDLKTIHARYETYMHNSKLPVLRLNTLEEGWMEKAEEFVNE